MRDPLVAVYADVLTRAGVANARAVAAQLAAIARAQRDIPDIRPRPLPVAECPDGCPVGQAWQARARRAEARAAKEQR